MGDSVYRLGSHLLNNLAKEKNSIGIPITEKYDYIGRLLRPGETSRNYSDGESAEGSSSEEESEQVANTNRPKSE